jgi:hypothetical protein
MNACGACTSAHVVIVSQAVKENDVTEKENVMTGLHFLSAPVLMARRHTKTNTKVLLFKQKV